MLLVEKKVSADNIRKDTKPSNSSLQQMMSQPLLLSPRSNDKETYLVSVFVRANSKILMLQKIANEKTFSALNYSRELVSRDVPDEVSNICIKHCRALC